MPSWKAKRLSVSLAQHLIVFILPMTLRNPSTSNNTLSVSALNQKAKQLLELNFPSVLVTGEISNLAKPSSGHWYFSLKDDRAQVRCAMFRSKTARLGQHFKEGDQVLVRASLSLYEQRGDYQLIVDHINLAGVGALQAAFEALALKLKAEGLFDEALKRPLVTHPQRIGIITSATGAAIRDIISILKRRAPHIEIMIYPALVQGQQAPEDLMRALTLAYQHAWADMLILSRGGGSIEDLWAFNNEALARKIRQAPVPIISAVGHEVDVTIADFVADLRASTPSAAAELVAKDREQLLNQIAGLHQWLYRQMAQQLVQHKQQLDHLSKRLKHPRKLLQEQSQRLDRLELRLVRAQKRQWIQTQEHSHRVFLRLLAIKPKDWVRSSHQLIADLHEQLLDTMTHKLEQLRTQLLHHTSLLNALSPLNTLERGYSILLDEHNQPITAVEQTEQHQTIFAQLAKGHLRCQILEQSLDSKWLPVKT
jgi:exodeoxyribonuclease VII large subunit